MKRTLIYLGAIILISSSALAADFPTKLGCRYVSGDVQDEVISPTYVLELQETKLVEGIRYRPVRVGVYSLTNNLNETIRLEGYFTDEATLLISDHKGKLQTEVTHSVRIKDNQIGGFGAVTQTRHFSPPVYGKAKPLTAVYFCE